MRFLLKSSMLAVGMLAAVAGTSRAAFFANGSFENGNNAPNGGFNTLGGGNTDITGWTVNGVGIDWIHTSYWTASDGVRSLDLNSLGAGSVSQTFDTVNGQTYTVTFDLSGNPDGNAPNLKTLQVTAAAASQTYNYDRSVELNTYANMKWRNETFTFTATGTSTTLTFASTNGSAGGPALDNVTVTASAVPAPAGVLLGLLGLPALGVAGRLRRRAAVAG